jgi:flagellar biosynthesis anti-sigma factor FlgM
MIVNNNPTADVSLNLDKTQSSPYAAGSGAASNSGNAESSSKDDSVSLSNPPNLLQQALASSSAARSARVQELKALVQNNQYQPDAQAVSSALIDAHLAGV